MFDVFPTLLAALLIAPWAHAATNDLTTLLQRGLFEEEANRNIEAAISNYDSLAKAFDQNRQIAATAVFRLGECYRKLGRTNEAAIQYQRIVKEFPDQGTLATLSRQNLAGMNLSPAASGATQSESVSPNLKMVMDAEAEAISLQTQVEHLKALNGSQLVAVLQQNYPDPTLTKLVQNRNEAVQARVTLSLTVSTNHLKYQNNEDLIERIEKQISEHADGILLGLQNKAAVAAETAKVLRAQLGEAPRSKPSVREDLLVSVDPEDAEIQRIKTLIANSPDLVNSTVAGSTPLCKAAAAGQLRVVNYLLDHGANIDLKCGGEAPLHHATSSGNKAMVELLLKRGADVNATDSTGGTALHIATQNGFRTVAEVLLSFHADPNARNAEINQRRTPLHFAASLGHIEMMKLLIGAGADVNVRDKLGSTPLFDAIGAGKTDSLKTLLAAKSNPNLANYKGVMPISFAASKNEWASVQALLEAKADPNAGVNLPIFWAIRQQNPDKARVLLRAGADPNRPAAIDSSVVGYTISGEFATNYPLAFACGRNDSESVKALLEFKADPNGKAGWKDQAVIFNALFDTNVMKQLLEAGANPNVGTPEGGSGYRGETPLMMVVRGVRSSSDGVYTISTEGDLMQAKLLIDHGANVNARRPTDGATALHLAVQRRHQGLVDLLLASKADVNAQDDNGKTPLDFVGEPQATGFSLPPRAIIRSTVRLDDTQLGSPTDSIAKALRGHGAKGDLPRLTEIRIARSATGFSKVMYTKGSEDWNQVTVLEALLHYYRFYAREDLVCPDLASITVIRRNGDGTKEDRRVINFYNGPNRIDCSRDVPLQFGDVVEVPERVHSIGSSVGLTGEEFGALSDCLKGNVILIAGGQTTQLTLNPAVSTMGSVLGSGEARQALLTSSDLSKVKLTKHDLVSGKPQQWTVDCSNPNKLPEIWLHQGDIIEVPNK
jgi:ankyrin repeat protein